MLASAMRALPAFHWVRSTHRVQSLLLASWNSGVGSRVVFGLLLAKSCCYVVTFDGLLVSKEMVTA
jgi:hypothetical protein